MKIFDTHCHIASKAFDADREEVISRFHEAGVCRANVVADPCEEDPNQEKVFSIVETHAGLVGSIGVHPHNACRWDDAAEQTIRKYLKREDCRLLGEIGLDFHYDLSPRDQQRTVFDRQLEMAYELDIPVQLHIREAHDETVDMLTSRIRSGRMPAGIMHCYTGGMDHAKFYLDAGLYISLSGALTFKNAAHLIDVAAYLPADRALIETDCPYMAPVPLRGKRCEPAFITNTLARFAAIRGIGPDQIAQTLYENSLTALRVQDD